MSRHSVEVPLNVRVSTTPIDMGHEELVLPMRVFRSDARYGVHALGRFYRAGWPEGECTLNDLRGTSVVGFFGDFEPHPSTVPPRRVAVERMFVGMFSGDWESVPEIRGELDRLGTAFAFWCERSRSPLIDGYVARCRLVARDVVARRLGAEAALEAEQRIDARSAVQDFLERNADWDREACRPRLTPYDFGDDESWERGHALWIEQEGVLRCWTRIVYVPK